jgi:hypothetical protein
LTQFVDDKKYDSQHLNAATPKSGKTYFVIAVICIALALAIYLFGGPAKSGSPEMAAMVLLLVGVFFIYGGFHVQKRYKYEQQLLKRGECYLADISSCELQKNFDSEGSRNTNSYTLVCQYTNKSGVIKECKRYGLGYDPRPYIKCGKIKVYVDPANPRDHENYVIDIAGAMDSQPENR